MLFLNTKPEITEGEMQNKMLMLHEALCASCRHRVRGVHSTPLVTKLVWNLKVWPQFKKDSYTGSGSLIGQGVHFAQPRLPVNNKQTNIEQTPKQIHFYSERLKERKSGVIYGNYRLN